MAKHYQVNYTLVFDGGGKSTQATTLIMESNSASEAERKIRATNNINTNVREIRIDSIIER
jgi:hypothetical protein